VLGTFLHGPALARNPALADLLLSWVVGGTLEPLDEPIIDRLRAERLRAALSS
jgi:CobQ-like glutamine amidotransferase family enzyme